MLQPSDRGRILVLSCYYLLVTYILSNTHRVKSVMLYIGLQIRRQGPDDAAGTGQDR